MKTNLRQKFVHISNKILRNPNESHHLLNYLTQNQQLTLLMCVIVINND